MMKLVAALACIAMPVSGALAGQAPAAPVVTVQQASVEDPGHPPIIVGIWSPAELTGSAVPLVVMSHGTGAGPMAHVDTAQALAEAGFVVVAPMHPGDNFQDDSAVGRPEWMANRSRHVSRAVDYMLTQWAGHERLSRRVGMFGLSAGATTALISAGGTPDLGRVAPHCAARPEFVCRIMAPPAADAAAPQFVHDSRVAAVVIAAPGLGFTFEPAGLADVRVPVQLWVGGADETVPTATNGAVVRRLLPTQPEFHEVENAVHLSFLAPCGPGAPPAICQDAPGFDRAAFHGEFNAAVVAFFRRHLGAD